MKFCGARLPLDQDSGIQLGRVSLVRTDKGIWVSLEAVLGAAVRGIWVSGYLGIDRAVRREASHGDLIHTVGRRDRFGRARRARQGAMATNSAPTAAGGDSTTSDEPARDAGGFSFWPDFGGFFFFGCPRAAAGSQATHAEG